MKKRFISFVFLIAGILMYNAIQAQCTPGDSLSCPDPENNGEVCPDSLPDAIVNQFFQQEFTILPPPEYHDTTSGITVELHHLRILDVGNLPTGITWVSNAADSIFFPETYYCVLMEGTPTEKGDYPLKIQVEVYINFFGTPVLADTVTDSTSLAIHVTDPSGINDYKLYGFKVHKTAPNPFYNKLDIGFSVSIPGQFTFELYDLLGNKLNSQKLSAQYGENHFYLDDKNIKPGMYIFTIFNNKDRYASRVIKSE